MNVNLTNFLDFIFMQRTLQETVYTIFIVILGDVKENERTRDDRPCSGRRERR